MFQKYSPLHGGEFNGDDHPTSKKQKITLNKQIHVKLENIRQLLLMEEILRHWDV